MKKPLLYILIAIICVNSFSKQLYKVPVLIVHYTEHHALDNRVGFVDFLAMHYWDSDAGNSRDERDSQLPFKKFEHEAFSQPMIIPVSIAFALRTEPNFKSVFRDYHEPHVENAPVGSIFKPPRLV